MGELERGFLPHTDDDVVEMLAAAGLGSLDELFDPVPAELRLTRPLDVPPALSEVELAAHLEGLAAANRADLVCFAGGGAYDHHVPAAVRALAFRAEFATSYTPYQPELSQGVLQALWEFQSEICELFGMEVANASLYDGAAAVAEAANLALRATGRRRIVVAASVHPHHRAMLATYGSGLGLELVEAPFGPGGTVDWAACDLAAAAAVIVQHPNFFGCLEDVAGAARAIHDAGGLLIVSADPTAMGVLEAPGAFGADVVVGEGQGLGNPLSYGGPYVGLFATTKELIRQVPGRIAGETVDADGRRAFTLTLRAREQDIRRAKATSNVCTNQTLMAIANAVHLAWLGPEGLARLGEICLRRTARAAAVLGALPGCSLRFDGPRFKELVLATPLAGEELCTRLAARGFLVGPALGRYYPGLEDAVVVAVTEKRTEDDIAALAEALEKELAEA